MVLVTYGCVLCRTQLKTMSGDVKPDVKLAKPNKEQLISRYGARVASKLLSIDADIRQLYKRAVDSVGQDAARLAQLAEPLCQYVAEAEMQRRRRRWLRLMLCFTAAVVLLSCLVSCETSCQFICAVARIVWIKVDYDKSPCLIIVVNIPLNGDLTVQLINNR